MFCFRLKCPSHLQENIFSGTTPSIRKNEKKTDISKLQTGLNLHKRRLKNTGPPAVSSRPGSIWQAVCCVLFRSLNRIYPMKVLFSWLQPSVWLNEIRLISFKFTYFPYNKNEIISAARILQLGNQDSNLYFPCLSAREFFSSSLQGKLGWSMQLPLWCLKCKKTQLTT